jgi:hypothetical protein
MRSLWKDTGTVEDTLPQLQKVGDELAANSGHCSLNSAHGFSRPETSVTEKVLFGRSSNARKFDKGTNRWLSAKK